MENKFVTFFSKKAINSGYKRITVNGNMAGHRVTALETELLDTLKTITSEKFIILDLTNVDYIDSCGIALCILLYKECKRKSFEFSIESSSNIYRILNQINLNRVFPIKRMIKPVMDM